MVLASGGALAGNTAGMSGGGIHVGDVGIVGSLRIEGGGRLANNSAVVAGGGMYAGAVGELVVVDGGEVSGNRALDGGGVAVRLGVPPAAGLARRESAQTLLATVDTKTVWA